MGSYGIYIYVNLHASFPITIQLFDTSKGDTILAGTLGHLTTHNAVSFYLLRTHVGSPIRNGHRGFLGRGSRLEG